MKRTLFAVLAVFVLWTGMDFVIHGMILSDAYAASQQLWRPISEMKMLLMNAVVLATAALFVFLYAWLIEDRSVKRGVQYGILCGLGGGISMGFGSYAAMPIPDIVALWWFLGRFIEAIAAGWLIGIIVKKQRKSNWAPFGIRERWDYIK